MRDREKHDTYASFILVASIFGLAVSAAFLGKPDPFVAASNERRVIIAFAYDLVCIVGMLAVLFPVACSQILGIRALPTEASQERGIRATRFMSVQILHGHHPLESTKRHELLIMGRSFCATCYGLLAGAVLSLVTVTVFGLSGWSVWTDTHPAYFMYLLGVSGVSVGLSQGLMPSIRARTRFALSFLFVVGTGLMLLSTDLLTANLGADLFVVLLAVFWLLSRISLSHRS